MPSEFVIPSDKKKYNKSLLFVQANETALLESLRVSPKF